MTTKAKPPRKPATKAAKRPAGKTGQTPAKTRAQAGRFARKLAEGLAAVEGRTPPVLRTPRHGKGKLRVGGDNGGAGGRPPDAFKAMCRELASRDETVRAVTAILADRDHPAYLGALKWASEHGYGRPTQPVEHAGDVTLRIEYAEDDD